MSDFSDTGNIPHLGPVMQSSQPTEPSTMIARPSDAESWLNAIRDGMLATGPGAPMVHSSAVTSSSQHQPCAPAALPPVLGRDNSSFSSPFAGMLRTTSLDYPTANFDHQQFITSQGIAGSMMSSSWGAVTTTSKPPLQGPVDPFDAEWAKLAASAARNPFIGETISKSFELRL